MRGREREREKEKRKRARPYKKGFKSLRRWETKACACVRRRRRKVNPVRKQTRSLFIFAGEIARCVGCLSFFADKTNIVN